MLSKDQIKAAQDRPRQWVAIPEWTPGGETFDPHTHGVWVGAMSARDRDAWELEVFSSKSDDAKRNHDNARAKLAVRTVQDRDGNRIFSDDDAAWLGEKAAAPLATIFDVAMRLNRLTKADHEELVAGF